MNKSKIDINQVSKIANLTLNIKQKAKFTKQLQETLKYVEELDQLDTENISPTFQTNGLKNVFRPDKIKSCLSQKQALSGSPSTHRGYFKINSVFNDN